MSAIATKKPGSNVGLQLTFPEVFSEVADRFHLASAYYPEGASRPMVLEQDPGLQGSYHQQKMEDANRMVRAKIQSADNADYRFLHSHQNYYGMPRPVLSQRIYANPSNGNQADIYSARPNQFVGGSCYESPYESGGMRGGVLFTAEAQKWGRSKLQDRIAQLDAIDAAKQSLQSGVALSDLPAQQPFRVSDAKVESLDAKAKIEMVQTLQAIASSVEAGLAGTFAFNDVVKFLRLLFRYASTADVEELKEIYEYCNMIEESLLGLQAQAAEFGDSSEQFNQRTANLDTMTDTFRRIRDYLDVMIREVNRSPAERRVVSMSLVKSLGFTRLLKVSPEEAKSIIEQQPRRDQAERNFAFSAPPLPSEYEVDDEVDFRSQLSSFSKAVSRASLLPAFSRQRRADSAASFDPSVRNEMGDANGAWLGNALPSESASSSSQGFRSGTGEDQSQGLEVAAEAAVSGAVSPRMSMAEYQRRKDEEEPVKEAIRQRIRADFGRDVFMQYTTPESLREFARMLRDKYDGWYKPQTRNTKWKSIKQGLIDAYGL
jgi:hypothetical protein